jgi:hypothetical protein
MFEKQGWALEQLRDSSWEHGLVEAASTQLIAGLD